MSGDASPSFRYQGIDRRGESRQGRIVAAGAAQALAKLTAEGLTVTQLQPDTAAPTLSPAQSAVRAGTVRRADQAQLLAEIASLLQAGVSMAELAPTLADAWARHPLGAPLAQLSRALQSGRGLGETLAESGFGLAPHLLSLIRAGEASGDLAEAFADAAAQLEYEHQLAQDLRSALIYPSLLILVGIGAVLTILMVVVPRFALMLRHSTEIPALSRLVINAGLWLQQHWLGLAIGLLGLVVVLVAVWRAPPLQRRLLGWAGGLPLLGPWLIDTDIGRWATLLGTLTQRRVPLLEALALSRDALRLPALHNGISAAQAAVRQGQALSEVLAAQGWIPATRLNLLRVGERAGQLPAMLRKLGALHSAGARQRMQRLLALVEPVAILLIGGAVGFIMVAVMLTLTSLGVPS